MSCKNCSDNSSSTYTRCPEVVSTNCVFYKGDEKTCPSDVDFFICKGANLTQIQSDIFDKICQLSGSFDVNNVVIPNCPFLQDAWDDQDFTILNLFNMSLQLECELKAQIDALDAKLDTNNPIVSGLDFCCCSVDCNTGTAEIRLTDALKQIIECLCIAKAEAKAAYDLAASYSSTISQLQVDVGNLKDFNTAQVIINQGIATRLCKIEKYFINEGISLPTC